MKRIITGALALLFSSIAMSATMIPSSMINWTSVPTWPSVSAGLVFASPAGASGAPTFRALAVSDIPIVTVAKGGTGATTASGARAALGAAASGANTDIASLNAPALGAATAATAAAGDNSTKVATTAYVQGTVTGGANAAAFTTVNAVGLITPSSTAGIKGTAAGDNANAGSIGESIPASASSISLTNSSWTNVTSTTLSAGDWNVSGWALVSNGGANITNVAAGFSTTSAAQPTAGNYWQFQSAGNTQITAQALPTIRLNLTSSTTVYCVAFAAFTSGATTASCSITPRRVR